MRLPVLAAQMARMAPLALVLGCGGGKSPSGPAPRAVDRSGDRAAAGEAPPTAPTETALPADLPERLELEVRRRTADGEDRVLKLTPAGARYGLSHGKARIALRYRLEQDALASVWATLRQEGFDRLQTAPREGAAVPGGTSLRVSTGTESYSAAAMGRQVPDDAEAYARCLAASEALLPSGRSEIVVLVRWDASMRDRSAGLDVDVGEDLVGLHRVPTEPSSPDGAEGRETFELHLARARPLELQLRERAHASTLVVQAGVDRGVEVAFDAARGEAVARPLPAAAVAPAPP